MNDHTTNDRSFVGRINETIARHLDNEQFGVDELARELGVSRFTLHRKLQLHTGKSASQLIRETRLAKGKELLENTALTVSEIAYLVGFNSATYFNTCFREFYGYTPGEVKSGQTSQNGRKYIPTRRYIWVSLSALLLLVIVYFCSKLFTNNINGVAGPDASGAALESVDASDRSVVVLSFENLSNDPEQEFFCKGMVYEIRARLVMIGGLTVKSDTMVLRSSDLEIAHVDIGTKYGTSYILGGSVRRVGDEIRVIPELIDVKTGTHIWSHQYDGNLQNISELFSFSDTVAEQIASSLKTTITAEEAERMYSIPKTTNKIAYQYYLKGLDYWNSKGDYVLALEMFSNAIEEDPSFASAYARRAMMHAFAYHRIEIDDWVSHDQMAWKDIEKANQLAPGTIEVKLAEAVYYYYTARNYEQALSILNQLKEELPNMPDIYAYISYIKRRQGKWAESIEQLERAMELEPFNAVYIETQCITFQWLRNYDMAFEIVKKGLEKIPDNGQFRRWQYHIILRKTGNVRLALETSGLNETDVQREYYEYTRQFDKAISFINENRSNHFYPNSYFLASYYYYKGDTDMSKIYADSAIQILERMMNEYPVDNRVGSPLSSCYAIIGDREKAMNCVQKTLDTFSMEWDRMNGYAVERWMIKTYIILGEYELAFDKIDYLLSIPGLFNAAMLWLEPDYYELRNFPRFWEILRAHNFEPPDDDWQSE